MLMDIAAGKSIDLAPKTPIETHINELDAASAFNTEIVRSSFMRIRKEIEESHVDDNEIMNNQIEGFIELIEFVKTSTLFYTLSSIDDVNNIMDEIKRRNMVSVIRDVTFDYLLHSSGKLTALTIVRIVTAINAVNLSNLISDKSRSAESPDLTQIIENELWLVPLYILKQVEF